jgi:hypothetical protein
MKKPLHGEKTLQILLELRNNHLVYFKAET